MQLLLLSLLPLLLLQHMRLLPLLVRRPRARMASPISSSPATPVRSVSELARTHTSDRVCGVRSTDVDKRSSGQWLVPQFSIDFSTEFTLGELKSALHAASNTAFSGLFVLCGVFALVAAAHHCTAARSRTVAKSAGHLRVRMMNKGDTLGKLMPTDGDKLAQLGSSTHTRCRASCAHRTCTSHRCDSGSEGGGAGDERSGRQARQVRSAHTHLCVHAQSGLCLAVLMNMCSVR